jgi:hypothetical protein
MMKWINTIYKTRQWPKDLTEVTIIALNKKPQATKCSDHRTICFIAHTAKMAAKYLEEELKKELRLYSEKITLGFRRGKGTGAAIG